MHLRALRGLELAGSDLTRPKPLLLLTYLALEGPQTRRHLGELFWLHAANPLASLSMALTQLRKAAPGSVNADDQRVETTVSCDVLELLRAAGAAEPERVLELYRGPFLDGVHLRDWGAELEEWVLATRELLAGHARKAMLRIAEREAARRSFTAAARLAEDASSLRGAPALDSEEIELIYSLLKAGDSPQAQLVQREGGELGLQLNVGRGEARDLLSASRANRSVSSLPASRTPFVGRDQELAHGAKLLTDPDTRLLTLLGPAGVGKTRLALQLAAAQLKLGTFPGGVHLVALESVALPEGLLPALARVLGLELAGELEPQFQISAIADHLGQEDTLLVFDNFEHLTSAAPVLSQLAAACQNVTPLVTSRERLQLEEETVLPVEGLPVLSSAQPSVEEALGCDAVQLFVRRATKANPAFELTAGNLPAVMRICRHLEGLPLGLELAAVWLKTLPAEDLAAELERSLDLLLTPARNVAERNRSLRSAFEHSWQLLSDAERASLRRLAPFRGGFSREAAAKMGAASIPLLAALVDKSLLRVDATGRYDRHPLLWQFTLEKLAAEPEQQASARYDHAIYFVEFLVEQQRRLGGSEANNALAEVEKELSNLTNAAIWLAETSNATQLMRVTDTLRAFFDLRKRYSEGVALFRQLLGLLPRSDEFRSVRGALLRDKAWLLQLSGQHAAARDLAERALALVEDAEDELLVAKCHNVLASCAWQAGDYAAARGSWSAALELALSAGADAVAAALAANLALALHALGDLDGARKRLETSLEVSRRQGDEFHVVRTLNKLGVLQMDLGDLNAAEGSFGQARGLAEKLGFLEELPRLLINLGIVAFERNELTEAQHLTEQALSSLAESNDHSLRAYALARLGRVAAGRADPPATEPYLAAALAAAPSDRAVQAEVASALADLRAFQERYFEAATLLSLLTSFPGVEAAARDRYVRRFEALSAGLPTGSAVAAQRAGEELLRRLQSTAEPTLPLFAGA